MRLRDKDGWKERINDFHVYVFLLNYCSGCLNNI